MTTQYTSILKLALPVQGELSGTWGDVVNDNITSMVEEAIAGRAVIDSWTTNSHTLTSANGTTSESRCAMLEFTDTGTALTGDATVVCPTAAKIYICKNDAGQKVTIKTSAGTGVAIADGQTMFVFCDGTNVVEAVTSMSSLKLGTAVTSIEVTSILDEDDLVSDSATALATQQSIKAYVDAQVTAQDLDFGGDSGTGSVDLDSQTFTIAGTSNEIETSASGQTLTVGLPAAVTVTTSVTTPTVQVTDVKANDGTAAVSIADTTGQTTIVDAVLTTADINAGTIDNTTIGSTTASTGAFTTITSSGNTTVSGSLVTDTISEETATAGVTVDGVLLKDGGATLTGDLTVDTDTLYVDTANDRVGIGTSSPAAPLEVSTSTADYRIQLTHTSGQNKIKSLDGDQSTFRNLLYDAVAHMFEISGSEAMRIDSSGNVGIGTTNPSSLDVTANDLVVGGGTGNKGITIFSGTASTGGIVFADGNDGSVAEYRGWMSYDHSTDALRFASASTERMRIDSSGQVGIGTSSPSVPLDVVGTILVGENRTDATAKSSRIGAAHYTTAEEPLALIVGSSSATDNIVTVGGGTSQFNASTRIRFFTAANTTTTTGTERMRIDSSGNVGIGTSSISTRLHVYDGSDSVVGGFQSGAANAIIGFDSATTSGSVLDANVGIGATGDDLRFRSGGGFRGTLDSTGRLGIGVTPSISSTVGPSIDVNGVIAVRQPLNSHQTSVGVLEFNSNDFGLRAYGATAGTGSMSFSTGGGGGSADTKRLVIQSNGNVGLGNTSPSALAWPNGTTGGLFLQDGGLFSAYNAGTNMSQNWYYNGGEKYIGNGYAQRYTQSAGDHVWETALNNTGGAGSGLSWSEKMRISNSGHVGIGTTAANNTSEGAGLQVRKYINRVQYYSPAGAYAGSFGYTDNTSPRTWISVDSNYNQGSAVSAGLFLSAWHGDANGSTIGYTFKNNRADQSLVWSRVTSATSVGASANEAEFMRLSSAGNLSIGTNTAYAGTKLALQNDGADTFIHTNPNSFNGTYKSGIRFSASIVSAPLYYQGEIAFKGDNNYSGNMIFSTAPGGTTNAVIERMRITSGGHIGMFTTAAAPPLSTATYTLTIGDRNNTAGHKTDMFLCGDTAGTENYISRIFFKNSTQTGGSAAQIRCHRTGSNYGTSLVFHTQGLGAPGDGAERMRIDNAGDVQIGKTDGTQNTRGIILNSYGTIRANSQTTEALHLIRSTAGNIARFYYNNTTLVGNINVTSTATQYNTSSDYRLKENVVELSGATDRLKQLEPKRFNFIDDADTTVDGFLAHEVQSVVPEAISGEKDAVDADGNPEYQGIDHSKLVPLLVATIKELEARITALENA